VRPPPRISALRIDELYINATEPVFSFEFFPPKTEQGEQNFWNAVEELKSLDPAFVSVTYGAGGSTKDKTLELVSRVRDEVGIEAMAHFTCVGATVEQLREQLDAMSEAGLENVLALRGDPPRGQEEWRKTPGGLEFSAQLVTMIRGQYPQFAIGGACFPETHIHASSPEDDLRYLKDKVDAGARFLITQLFFDNEFYFDFVARARDIGIDVPIIPGIWPITDVKSTERACSLSGAKLPGQLLEQLHAREDSPEGVLDFGVAYATLQCAELLHFGAPGVHFYTLNRSPATRAILSALKLMRPWDRSRFPLCARG
jgi:methylenetetrahydrofolate reductase (NADPH)